MKNIKRKYQIFVSSTYDDLVKERKDITNAILKCDCIPAGMELWPASNDTQWETIKNIIDESDLYLVVVGGKYGSGVNGISYTQKEYLYAESLNKPIVALIHRHPEKLPAEKYELDEEKRSKLKKFKNQLTSGRIVDFWETSEELSTAVVTSIHKFIDSKPVGGWIKAEEISQLVNNASEGLSRRGSSCRYTQDLRIFAPKSIDDVPEIIEELDSICVAILEFKDIEKNVAQRIIDMIACHAYSSMLDLHSLDSKFVLVVNHDR